MTGAVELAKDKEMVMPGDNVSITVKLINPIAMEEGLRFAIREGGRTVGAGVVAKILRIGPRTVALTPAGASRHRSLKDTSWPPSKESASASRRSTTS